MAYSSFAIDTVAFSLLLRGNEAVGRIIRTAEEVAMPLVVIAELRAGFLHGCKASKYGPILDDFLSDPHTTILHITAKTIPLYAEFYAYTRAKGRQLSSNDLWIAALCVEHNYPLLTFDKDFDALPQVRRVRA